MVIVDLDKMEVAKRELKYFTFWSTFWLRKHDAENALSGSLQPYQFDLHLTESSAWS